MDFGGIFGAVGQIAGAAIQAKAIKDATKLQIEALEKQKKFVYDELEPGKIGAAAEAADIRSAQDRLALQSQLDPALVAARYQAQQQILGGLGELGKGDVAAVQQAAVSEALGGGSTKKGQQALIDAALGELAAGATLPSDVQSELVKAGLERSGMTVGSAATRGFGGRMARELIGQAGLKLRQQRLENAQNLLARAQDLQTQRQTLLTQLFPTLANKQIAQLGAQQAVLGQSNELMPASAGLTGTDVANLWLARVGATNTLAKEQAAAGKEGRIAATQVWTPAIGAASQALGKVGSEIKF